MAKRAVLQAHPYLQHQATASQPKLRHASGGLSARSQVNRGQPLQRPIRKGGVSQGAKAGWAFDLRSP